jgi:hypothetical protein
VEICVSVVRINLTSGFEDSTVHLLQAAGAGDVSVTAQLFSDLLEVVVKSLHHAALCVWQQPVAVTGSWLQGSLWSGTGRYNCEIHDTM